MTSDPRILTHKLPRRQSQQYPPFSYLALVLVTDPQAKRAEEIATRIAQVLSAALPGGDSDHSAQLLGPVYAPIQRIRRKTRIQLLLKSAHRPELHRLLNVLDAVVDQHNWSGVVAVDVDPQLLL